MIERSDICRNSGSEIRVKMLLANEAARCLNQLYHQNNVMRNSDFLHVDTNSLKLKIDWKKSAVSHK